MAVWIRRVPLSVATCHVLSPALLYDWRSFGSRSARFDRIDPTRGGTSSRVRWALRNGWRWPHSHATPTAEGSGCWSHGALPSGSPWRRPTRQSEWLLRVGHDRLSLREPRSLDSRPVQLKLRMTASGRPMEPRRAGALWFWARLFAFWATARAAPGQLHPAARPRQRALAGQPETWRVSLRACEGSLTFQTTIRRWRPSTQQSLLRGLAT